MTWPERLDSYSETDPDTGCRIWQHAKNSRGYGVLWADGRLHLAHRLAWLLEHGSLPPAPLVLDHICNRKDCVNAAHLRPLDNSSNIRRAIPRGDAETERRRAASRAATARYRARLATKGG